MVLALVVKYEHLLANPDTGKPYDEVYDVDVATPKAWWLEVYQEAKCDSEKELGLAL